MRYFIESQNQKNIQRISEGNWDYYMCIGESNLWRRMRAIYNELNRSTSWDVPNTYIILLGIPL